MNEWIALRIRKKCEQFSAQALTLKGYETYLPTYLAGRVGHNGRLRELPLYPGYLFCRLAPETVGKIVTTPGVISFVRNGREPARVEESEIETVRRVVTSNIARQPWRFMPAGTIVRVEDGPLAGVCGILISAPGGRRLVVSINLLQRSVAAILDSDVALTPLGSANPQKPLAYCNGIAERKPPSRCWSTAAEIGAAQVAGARTFRGNAQEILRVNVIGGHNPIETAARTGAPHGHSIETGTSWTKPYKSSGTHFGRW